MERTEVMLVYTHDNLTLQQQMDLDRAYHEFRTLASKIVGVHPDSCALFAGLKTKQPRGRRIDGWKLFGRWVEREDIGKAKTQRLFGYETPAELR